MERRLSTLVETVSKKAIPPHVKDIVFEVMVNDEEGEDVEVRFVFRRATRGEGGELMRAVQVPYLKVRVR